MSSFAELRVYKRIPRVDRRGWLLKVMDGSEVGLADGFGEAYAVASHPGEARGHHLHPRAREWFTIVQGEAWLDVELPLTGEQRRLALTAAAPVTVEIPPGMAHVIIATGNGPMLMVAVSSLPHDPLDVEPYRVDWRGGVV